MNPLLVLASLLLATPAAVVTVDAVDGGCYGTPCDQINEVCHAAFGVGCVRSADGPQEPRCIDQEPYSEWCGNLVAAIGDACRPATGESCWDDGEAAGIQCIASEPWYSYCTAVLRACKDVAGKACLDEAAEQDCAGSVCDTINRVCRKVGDHDCVAYEAAHAETLESDVPDVRTPHCMGEVCDAVNQVCYAGRKVLPPHCVE